MGRLTRVIPVLVCTAAFVLSVGTAGATVIGHEHYSGTESSSFDDCGFTLNVESEFRGNALLRVEKGGQAFLASDNYWFRDVLTNADTGGWFVVRGNGLFHEIKATHVRGTIYEFVAVESGQPFVIEDSAGKVVLRDRGTISFTYLFDTLGDGEPGGEFVEELEVSVRGPHPGFGDDLDFCGLAAELTGA